MRQRLLHRVPVIGVERQHLVQQVQGAGIGAREQPIPRHLWLERQCLQVVAGLKWFIEFYSMFYSRFLIKQFHLFVDNTLEIVLGGGAQHAQDVVQLVQVVFARKDRPIAQHFRQYTAHRPNVNRLRVAL